MRRGVWIVVVIAVAVAIWVANRHHGPSARSGGAAKVNSPAPDFSLKALDGSPLKLADYRGQVVLLDFWATWCVPCKAEIPHFIEFQDKYRAQGFQVVGISMDDDANAVRKFYQDFKMNYPVVVGTPELADAYGGVLGLPVTFLIARDGRVAAKYVGEADMAAVEQQITGLLATSN